MYQHINQNNRRNTGHVCMYFLYQNLFGIFVLFESGHILYIRICFKLSCYLRGAIFWSHCLKEDRVICNWSVFESMYFVYQNLFKIIVLFKRGHFLITLS